MNIRTRTREIQYQRGLGPHPSEYDNASFALDSYSLSSGFESKSPMNEIDDLSLKSLYSRPTKVIVNCSPF